MGRKLPSHTSLQRVVLTSIAAVASALSMASVGGLAEHYAAALPGAAAANRYAVAAPRAATAPGAASADRYAAGSPASVEVPVLIVRR